MTSDRHRPLHRSSHRASRLLTSNQSTTPPSETYKYGGPGSAHPRCHNGEGYISGSRNSSRNSISGGVCSGGGAPSATRVSFPTATYVSQGLRSASQMADGSPPLFVAYREGDGIGRSMSSSDLPQVRVHSEPVPSLPGPSAMLRGYPCMSLTLPPRRFESPPPVIQRSASLDDEQLSSEYEDDSASTGSRTVFFQASHNGPWDEFVEPYNHQFICVWNIDSGRGGRARQICGQIGDKRHVVTRHIKAVHLKIKPFTCRFCPKKFANNSNLEAHENTHTGSTPYGCPFCKRLFSDRAGLHRHKIKDHDYTPKSKRTQAVFVAPVLHPAY